MKENEFKRPMSLREFCDRYEAKIIKDPECNNEILYLTGSSIDLLRVQ